MIGRGPFNSVIGSNSELSSSLRGAYQFQNGKNGNRNGMKENGVVNSSSGEIVNGTTKVLSSQEENEKQKIYFQEQTKRFLFNSFYIFKQMIHFSSSSFFFCYLGITHS